MNIIDFHCHSNYSDGALSPSELLTLAEQSNITSFALTDHDTMEGVRQLQQLMQDTSSLIHLIPGVELSTRWKKYDIHVVGLNIDLNSVSFTSLLKEQAESRVQRAREIGDKLLQADVKDAFQKAAQIAGHDHIARPHFAQLLVNEGLVSDRQAAFKRYLGRGKLGYVPTTWISLQTAIEEIHAAKGVAVLAHPFKYRLTSTKLHEIIKDFKDAGGDALEVVSGEMTENETWTMASLAAHYQLLASSGSDFHGPQSRISLGRQRQLPVNCIPVWHQWTS